MYYWVMYYTQLVNPSTESPVSGHRRPFDSKSALRGIELRLSTELADFVGADAAL